LGKARRAAICSTVRHTRPSNPCRRTLQSYSPLTRKARTRRLLIFIIQYKYNSVGECATRRLAIYPHMYRRHSACRLGARVVVSSIGAFTGGGSSALTTSSLRRRPRRGSGSLVGRRGCFGCFQPPAVAGFTVLSAAGCRGKVPVVVLVVLSAQLLQVRSCRRCARARASAGARACARARASVRARSCASVRRRRGGV
jgi:hypothetical protein